MTFIVPFIPLIVGVATVATSIISSTQKGNQYSGGPNSIEAIYEDQAEAMVETSYDQQARADEAEILAYQNAANTEAETYESARRATKENEVLESTQRARAAASGVVAAEGSSTGLFLEDQSMENSRQVDWLVQAGLSKADIERWQGSMTKEAGYDEARHTRSMAGITAKRGKAAGAQGRNIKTSGFFEGAKGALSLGADIYSDWGTGNSSDLSKAFG